MSHADETEAMEGSRPTERVAVVTGGSGGIGGAIAELLVARGMGVAIWDLAPPAASDGGLLAVAVDVTDRDRVEAAHRQTETALGPVDVLVNNAGIDIIAPFLDSTEDEWRRTIEVNLIGTVRCCHVVVPGMVERERGSIVNIASDAGRVGSSGEVVYSGTKGGVIAFTKALAREVARASVRANCVCPGPTDTPLLAQVADHNPRLVDALSRAIPMRRIGQPADVAPAVAFLASDDAGYITGQTLSVSGGLTMA
jgi:2-hydroxycyclohexanecarboxyl-CoA dehydrogenase